ncbi:MAG: helix-turn-helix domain-containing protein, partial [Aquificota bacterium]
MSKLLNFSYKTIKRWWKDYEKGGLDKLLEWNVKG